MNSGSEDEVKLRGKVEKFRVFGKPWLEDKLLGLSYSFLAVSRCSRVSRFHLQKSLVEGLYYNQHDLYCFTARLLSFDGEGVKFKDTAKVSRPSRTGDLKGKKNPRIKDHDEVPSRGEEEF